MENLKPPDAYSRSISCESEASNYTDAMSYIDDDNASDYDGDLEYNSDDGDLMVMSGHEESGETMHPNLYRDIENLIFLYGEKSMAYRLFETIDEIDVELHIPVTFLEDVIAEAWKVNRFEPLIVRLHLSLSRYLESSNCPRVEVFQPSKKEGFGFGSQVRKYLENFMFVHWKELNVEYRRCIETEELLKKSFSFPVETKSEEKSTSENSSQVSDESVARLVELGFEACMARNALIITHGDVTAASELILNSPGICQEQGLLDAAVAGAAAGAGNGEGSLKASASSSKNSSKGDHCKVLSKASVEACSLMQINICDDNTETSKTQIGDNKAQMGDNKAQSSDSNKGTNEKKAVKIKRQHSHPPVLNKLKKMLPNLTRTTSMMPGLDATRQVEDLHLMPLTTLDGKSAKNVPSLGDGFLAQIFRYVRQRIPTMNEYCVICDEQHVFQNGAMLKPAVCTRELCVFAFQTLGVMADAAEDIATGAEVVDLLINMTRFACKSSRKAIIFDPFPTVVHPRDPNDLLFSPKNKKFNEVETVLDAMPNMQEMSSAPAALKQKLNEKNPALYPLIQWIITSNRSHIVKLVPEKQLDFMVTPHQFLLLSSPPAKEAIFQEAKKKNGSTFAFHGSSIENWHSIIRQGLVSASGTKLQVNGAAYGNGIYLSPNISTSMGYSRMGYGSIKVQKNTKSPTQSIKPRFLSSHNITCIAICEVITSSYLKKNNAIWVCADPNHVCTRFFFVYEDGQVGDSSIDTQKSENLAKIRSACAQ